MKLITRDTDYAIRAVCFIAKSKSKVVSASELVKHLKIPRPFLRKILQVLNKKGLLKSHKGLGGGFSLKVDPGKIFVMDLREAFQGAFKLNECLFKMKRCVHTSTCKLKKRLDGIEKKVGTSLKVISIKSLLD